MAGTSSYFDCFTTKNINDKDDKDRTPLIVAITTENLEHVRRMIDLGADPNLKSCDVYPLELSVEKGNLKLVKLLARSGAKVEKSYIKLAKRNGHDTVVGYLSSLVDDSDEESDYKDAESSEFESVSDVQLEGVDHTMNYS